MANRGKAAGKKAVSDGKPSDSEPEKGGTEISAWAPGFLNSDII